MVRVRVRLRLRVRFSLLPLLLLLLALLRMLLAPDHLLPFLLRRRLIRLLEVALPLDLRLGLLRGPLVLRLLRLGDRLPGLPPLGALGPIGIVRRILSRLTQPVHLAIFRRDLGHARASSVVRVISYGLLCGLLRLPRLLLG